MKQSLYFYQDEAPVHYAMLVQDWLDANLPGRWISRRGPLEQPSRSPDLTPSDFFLWSVLKDKVYSAKLRNIAELKEPIQTAIAQVPLKLCTKVCWSVPERLAKCIELHGEHTELK